MAVLSEYLKIILLSIIHLTTSLRQRNHTTHILYLQLPPIFFIEVLWRYEIQKIRYVAQKVHLLFCPL